MSEDSNLQEGLARNRECGSCTVCCKELKIVQPELKKFAGVLCHHCVDGLGCGIYETRPPVCRGWYCGWRQLPDLGDDWRPDRSGVLISYTREGIPAEFPQFGIKFAILGSSRVLAWDPLINFIAVTIESGTPAFLGVPAPVGLEGKKIFLNVGLIDAVRSRERERLVTELLNAFEAGVDAVKELAAVG